MILQHRALAWLVKLVARSVPHIAPKFSLYFIIAPKAVSAKMGLPKITNFWGVPKANSPRTIPLSFSAYSSRFSGLTWPMTKFFAALPEFATIFSNAATPVPASQPAEKMGSKFDEPKSMRARPGPAFSVARFFAASPENARKVVLLAEALHNLEAGPEKAKTTTNYNSHTIVESKKVNWIVLTSGLTVEKMVAKWPRETPHYWRAISAPVKMPVKATRPEWQKTKKSRSSSRSTVSGTKSGAELYTQYLDISLFDMDPRFVSRENPFKVLETIGDNEFQAPYCRKQQTRSVEIEFSSSTVAKNETTTDTSTQMMAPIGEPVPAPTSTPLAVVTPILAPDSLSMISPPSTPIFEPVVTSQGNTFVDSPKKSRRQRHRNTSTGPTPVLGRQPILMPFKETPEAWRQTSSPPRSPSPLNVKPKNMENEWQQVQTRKRRNNRNYDMDALSVPNFALTPTLAPEMARNNGSDETEVRHTSVVILYKNKKHLAPV